MTYKNTSFVPRTFYGVTFQPGEVKDVPGYINDPKFIPAENDTKPATSTTSAKPEPEPPAAKEASKSASK